MNNAADYCKSLDNVSKAELVNALHQSLMQLRAIDRHLPSNFIDNRGVITTNTALLAKAGHIGFTP